ncbi:MAG TPA: hypothetical protein VFN35_07990 [Ktedonobacteraceae bacterium]|nr:hypothetical protein [Ktedonobacteraceae bacterium]
MPVLNPERATMPRSALRYRSLQVGQARPGQTVSRRRTSSAPPTLPDVKEDDVSLARAPRQKRVASRRRVVHRQHPLFWLGVGVLLLLALWVGLTQLVTWATNAINDFRYGYPRAFQLDAVLGHQDSAAHPTHLLVLNLHGEILLEEMPGGDVSKARSYILTSLVGSGSDLLPVTLQLLPRQDRPGQPDLVVQVGDTISLMINDQGKFRPPTPAKRQQRLSLVQANR